MKSLFFLKKKQRNYPHKFVGNENILQLMISATVATSLGSTFNKSSSALKKSRNFKHNVFVDFRSTIAPYVISITVIYRIQNNRLV